MADTGMEPSPAPIVAPPRPDLVPGGVALLQPPEDWPVVPWRPSDVPVVFFVPYGVTTFVLFLLYAWFNVRARGATSQAIGILQEGAIAGVVLWWIRTVRPAPISVFGLPRRPWREARLGAGFGLLVLFASATVTAAVRSVWIAFAHHPPHVPARIATHASVLTIVLFGFASVVLAPVAEELLFRGFIYRTLRQRYGMTVGMLLSSGVFALVHIYPPVLPGLFVSGILLAVAYERRKSLLVNIVAHAINNLIAFVLIVTIR